MSQLLSLVSVGGDVTHILDSVIVLVAVRAADEDIGPHVLLGLSSGIYWRLANTTDNLSQLQQSGLLPKKD